MKKAYKGFEEENGKLYCRGMEYEVGKIYEHKGDIKLCSQGLHYCNKITDVHSYYDLLKNVICEVEILGDFIDGNNKSVTNKLKVLRKLSKEEVLQLANNGENNSGLFNSGDWNSGDRNSGRGNSGDRNSGYGNSGRGNSGDGNSGNRNSGDWNSGNRNSGNRNSGDRNSGYGNSGNRNSGDWNSGDWNSGDWNKTNGSNGFFNTKKETVKIFNVDSGMTQRDFRNSKWNKALNSVSMQLTEWINYTKEEMKQDENKKLIGGYLKTYSYKKACAIWWSKLNDKNKKIIQTIPNFDAKIFKEITGIEV